MRVPRELLRDLATVQDYGGEGARGPIYTTRDKPVRCSAQPTTMLVQTASGTTAVADLLVIVRPEDGPVAVSSRLTLAGVDYRVVQAAAMPDTRRPTHYQLAVSRFAAPAAAGGSGS